MQKTMQALFNQGLCVAFLIVDDPLHAMPFARGLVLAARNFKMVTGDRSLLLGVFFNQSVVQGRRRLGIGSKFSASRSFLFRRGGVRRIFHVQHPLLSSFISTKT